MHNLLINRIRGLAWMFKFENPVEIFLAKHIFQRRDPVVLRWRSLDILVDLASSDAHVVTEVLCGGMYDSAILDSSKGRNGRFRYLNLGANIGTFDLRVYQLLGENCEGMAVEMNPSACARLVMNLEINNLLSTRVLNAAVLDSRGEIKVMVSGRDTGQQCVNSAAGWPVPLIPCREIVHLAAADRPLDLVKIDIEGAEERALPSLPPETAALMRNIVIETHGAPAREACFHWLNQVRYTMCWEKPGPGQTSLSFWTLRHE